MLKENNGCIARVYIRSMPFDVADEEIYPIERNNEIMACCSEKVRREKYYVWKLLEVAIEDYLGVKITELTFEKNGRKWVCNKCYFSLSHSKDVVAVGISNYPIGVDIQYVETISNISSKILADGEDGDLLELWCKKEALYKAGNDIDFIPSKINTIGMDVSCERLSIADQPYILSVASRNRKYKQIKMDV